MLFGFIWISIAKFVPISPSWDTAYLRKLQTFWNLRHDASSILQMNCPKYRRQSYLVCCTYALRLKTESRLKNSHLEISSLVMSSFQGDDFQCASNILGPRLPQVIQSRIKKLGPTCEWFLIHKDLDFAPKTNSWFGYPCWLSQYRLHYGQSREIAEVVMACLMYIWSCKKNCYR